MEHETERMVDGCIVQVLNRGGHALHGRHPITHECVEIGSRSKGPAVARRLQAFRRILFGIVHEALRIELGLDKPRGA